MTEPSFEDLSTYFTSASELSGAEREEYLQLLAADNPELALEVRQLLASKALAKDFLDPPTQGTGDSPMRLLSLDFRGMKLGEFKALKELGRGAAGVVYLGEQSGLGRKVAIKILVPQLANAARVEERFRLEARAASRLRHPSIVSVLAFGEVQGLLYLVMEYVQGQTLHQHIEALRLARKQHRRPLHGTIDVTRPEVAAELALKLADALRYCHGEGLLHRDIKPQNILLDEDHSPRIVDFGLAKDTRQAGITQAGLISGTLPYMSPEQAQARSSALDARTDLYSLGAVLYEMLTLRRPLEARNDAELLRKVLNTRPVPPHHIHERIPKALSAICMRALAKSPEERYENAGEFAQDLQAFLAGRKIAIGARLWFEDVYRYVFIKRPWVAVTGFMLLVGLPLYLSPHGSVSAQAEIVAKLDRLSPRAVVEAMEEMIKDLPPEEQTRMREMLHDYMLKRIQEKYGDK